MSEQSGAAREAAEFRDVLAEDDLPCLTPEQQAEARAWAKDPTEATWRVTTPVEDDR